ncbi:CcdB family protein [Sphingomonas sp. PB2P19]|uniref:CcdB family protein n=1 Tax=Sphingomonas rhamnosi TaxID=3096156 RepID=UPI002FCC1DE0
MAQFDVFVLPDGTWVVDVQSDLLAIYNTRVVIPLIPPDADVSVIHRLHPSFDINGENRLLATQLISVVYRRILGPPIGSLETQYTTITAAIDKLVGGY